MNKNLTKLLAAAATTASTALWASTVAMETAKAATFSLKEGHSHREKYGTVTIKSKTAESVFDLFAEIGTLAYEEWQVTADGDPMTFYTTYYTEWGELEDASVGYFGNYLVDLREWYGAGDYVVFGREYGVAGVSFDVGGGPDSQIHTGPADWTKTVPEPSAAIALGVLGVGAVASRLGRRSK